jgi:Winged helix DNA-binding domain
LPPLQSTNNGYEIFNAKKIDGWMGAVQAQDYAMAKWAIGVRLTGSTDEKIERAINDAQIIRTHVLRPTWHFVSCDDLHWMLELTAPRILKTLSSRHRELELDENTIRKTNGIIEKTLAGRQLTRQEIMRELEKQSIRTNDARASHIMLNAELSGLVCNGSRREKQFTYALMEERVKRTKTYKKDEALAELAARYFSSHGPAALPDFVWWSGLSVTDAKIGLESVKSVLTSEKLDGKEYWFHGTAELSTPENETVFLLPAFDEFIISYKDRSAALDEIHFSRAISQNGMFKPVIVKNGKVIGLWQRAVKKDKVIIKLCYFKSSLKLSDEVASKAVKRFENFLNLEAEIINGE